MACQLCLIYEIQSIEMNELIIKAAREREELSETIKILKGEEPQGLAKLSGKQNWATKAVFWLEWIQAFLVFFDDKFLIKGKYQKPGVFKSIKILGQIFLMGLSLIRGKEIKSK